ncbi:MAG TPA: glycosyltransferase family 4 protein, partial [Planctomycetota bacterium]|nr:glycosyltransferase family 4 protein [Planctomycetota bacterium]
IVRSSLMIPKVRPVVLCVAAYVPWKRIELFFESVFELRRRVPNALGILVGSDLSGLGAGYEHELEQKRQDLGLGPECLMVLHERDDVPDLMAAADVLVSCSENEPFGRVIVEAGAAGLPVVSTRSGAKPELIEDGVSGALVDPRNAAQIAEACAKILNDDELRAKMGAGGRRIVSERFHVRRTAAELAQLFNSKAQQPAKA